MSFASIRDKVVLEQNGWHQARGTNGDAGIYRGFNVLTPYGTVQDEWLCWMVWQHASSYAVKGWSHSLVFKGKVRKGWLMALNTAITNGSAGPAWLPAIGGGGAGVDVTQSAVWSVIGTTNTNGWSALYPGANGRYIDLKVPSGTTRLYALGVAQKVTTKANINVSVQAGSATIQTPVLDFGLTGSFTAYGEMVYPPASDVAGSNYEGYPHYKSVSLVATSCGGSTLRFTSDFSSGDADYPYFVGFIAIDDNNEPSTADQIVFDPTTIEYLMPDKYTSSNEVVLYNQAAEGPLYFQIGSGTPTFWGNGHWGGQEGTNAANKLASESSYVCYDGTLFASLSGGTYTHPTSDVWLRHVAGNVQWVTSGSINVHDGSTLAENIGTYRRIFQWTPDGLSIVQVWQFAEAAQTSAVKLSNAGDTGGGYTAQWSLPNRFKEYNYLPYNQGRYSVGSYDNSFLGAYKSGTVVMFDSSYKIAAIYNNGQILLDASEGYTPAVVQSTRIYKKNTGDGYCKLYSSPLLAGTAFPLGANDLIVGWQRRTYIDTDGARQLFSPEGKMRMRDRYNG